VQWPAGHSCTSVMASRAFQSFNTVQSRTSRSALHAAVSHLAIEGTSSKDLASLPESHRTLGRVRIHHELKEVLRDFHLLEVRRNVQQELSRSLVRRHVSKSCRSCCWTMKSKRTPRPLNTGRPDEEAGACAVAIARRTIVAPGWSFFKVEKTTVTSWRIWIVLVCCFRFDQAFPN
jgi:hypothetical protein